MNTLPEMVSEETAQEILKAFGITQATRAYERWVKPNGFRLEDFWEVLSEVPFLLTIDWRAELEPELENILEILQRLEVQMQFEMHPDFLSGRIDCEGKSAVVRYCPADDGARIDDILIAVQKVIPERIQILALRANAENDTACYLLQSRDLLGSLSAEAIAIINHYFEAFGPELPGASDNFSVAREKDKRIPAVFVFKIREALQIPETPEIIHWISNGACEDGFLEFLRISPFLFEVDSKQDPFESIQGIQRFFEKCLALKLSVKMIESTNEVLISCGWCSTRLLLDAESRNCHPDNLVRMFKKVIPGRIEIRGLAGNREQAVRQYVVLPKQKWKSLDMIAANLIQKYFHLHP